MVAWYSFGKKVRGVIFNPEMDGSSYKKYYKYLILKINTNLLIFSNIDLPHLGLKVTKINALLPHYVHIFIYTFI